VKLHIAIALGLVGGLLLGLAAAATESPFLMWLANAVEPLGTAFINVLKMVVIPLVAAVIFVGVSSLGDLRKLGRMGAVTMSFFGVTAVIAVLLGMGTMKVLLPLASESAALAISASSVDTPALPGLVDFLLGLIPTNPFQAAAQGTLLPLIVFIVLFAAAAGTLPEQDRDRLLTLASAVAAALIKLVNWILWVAPIGVFALAAVAAALIKLVNWILWVAPIGVFALAAPVTARAGWAMLQSLLAFVLAVVVGLTVYMSLVYVPAVKFIAGMSLRRFLRGCLTPQAIAAATTSSPATVPAMLEAADTELGISPPVSSFVIPLGAALGRGGTALFQGAGIVFLAWLYSVSLAASGISGAVIATFIVSFTVPSIPGGSVLGMAPALGTVGIPIDGLAVLLGVDRVPDMARTAMNVTGTLTATVVIDRMEQRLESKQT
jgi:Na+/H+-dicarboxylate symporter